MSAVSYSLVESEGGRDVLTVFMDGDISTITSNHDNYVTVLEEVKRDHPNSVLIRQLINVEESINAFLSESVDTGRVSVSGGVVLFDGSPINGAVVNHLVNLYRLGDVYGVIALSRFLENAMQNPGGEKSMESLWSWMKGRNFTITDDGCFIAYKGVIATAEKNVMLSVHSGDATVDGVDYKSQQIPNKVGSTVTMPRKNVNDNTGVGCSFGLHAGTWDYAKGFARVTLAVKIDPRDVVSVPADCAYAKLRVSKYVIVSVAQRRFEETEENTKKEMADSSW